MSSFCVIFFTSFEMNLQKCEFHNKKIDLHSLADRFSVAAISCISPTVNFRPSDASLRDKVLELSLIHI